MRYNGVLDTPKSIETRLCLLEREIDRLGVSTIEATPEGAALMKAIALLTDVISVYRYKRFGLTYEQRLNAAVRIFYMGSY